MFDVKFLGGVLIIAGTSIGAGMLALPATTGPAGYVNSLFLFLAAFMLMVYTMLLILEASIASDKAEANMISMVDENLGLVGRVVAWSACLLLLYAVAAAYMTGGGAVITATLQHFDINLPSKTYGVIIFLVFFGVVAMLRTRWVDRVNRLLMVALISAFFTLIWQTQSGASQIKGHFTTGDANLLFFALPVVLLSFSAHPVLPSLCTYFNKQATTLKWLIVCGSLFPLVFYVVWQTVVMAILPLGGEQGLLALSQAPSPVTATAAALEQQAGLSGLSNTVSAFSFFALSTSFLAVALALLDFIDDGLSLPDFSGKALFLASLTLLPPFLFALFYPNGFVTALGYAGVFVAVLYILLPVLMVWQIRYRQQKILTYHAPGGRIMLVLAAIFGLMVIISQLCSVL